MKRFGLCLGGCEGPIENLIKQHLASFPKDAVYTLIEIGSAGCVSLRAFHDIVKENRSDGPWDVKGFDLSPDKAWSLNWPEIHESFAGIATIVDQKSPGHIWNDADLDSKSYAPGYLLKSMHLHLYRDPRAYLTAATFPIDFAFIDGCHGKCAAHDFEAIESKVRLGGLVMFHDVGVLEQGRDWQTHCGEYINVRKHITDLGLLNEKRRGWRLVGEIPGSRVWGGDGNSCAVFQKTL